MDELMRARNATLTRINQAERPPADTYALLVSLMCEVVPETVSRCLDDIDEMSPDVQSEFLEMLTIGS